MPTIASRCFCRSGERVAEPPGVDEQQAQPTASTISTIRTTPSTTVLLSSQKTNDPKTMPSPNSTATDARSARTRSAARSARSPCGRPRAGPSRAAPASSASASRARRNWTPLAPAWAPRRRRAVRHGGGRAPWGKSLSRSRLAGSVPPSITSHMRHRSHGAPTAGEVGVTRAGQVGARSAEAGQWRVPRRSRPCWPGGGRGGSRPRASGVPPAGSPARGQGSRGACPRRRSPRTRGTPTRRARARWSAWFHGSDSTRTPTSIEVRPAQLTWAVGAEDVADVHGREEGHLVHRGGDGRSAAVPLGHGAGGGVDEPHHLATVHVAEQVDVDLAGQQGQADPAERGWQRAELMRCTVASAPCLTVVGPAIGPGPIGSEGGSATP